jgi:hypothetical protein
LHPVRVSFSVQNPRSERRFPKSVPASCRHAKGGGERQSGPDAKHQAPIYWANHVRPIAG